MGLDMYLYRKTYVQNWSHHPIEKQHKVTVKVGNKVRKDIKPERVSYIIEQVAYWRKFNALHNWFVQNCGDGVDECQEIYVQSEQMEELLETLKKVKSVLDISKKRIKSVAGWDDKSYDVTIYDCEDEISELLPPSSGFFFGSEEIDEYYKNDVEETIKVIEGLLKEENETKDLGLYTGEFYYRASW